jgi:hypothetical protein
VFESSMLGRLTKSGKILGVRSFYNINKKYQSVFRSVECNIMRTGTSILEKVCILEQEKRALRQVSVRGLRSWKCMKSPAKFWVGSQRC